MKKIRVAVTQAFVSHYRASIYNLLSRQKYPMPEYVIVSDAQGHSNIKTVDPCKASAPLSSGGLNWRFIKNYPIGKHFLWQSGLLSLGYKKEFDAIIYLGNMYHLSTWIGLIIAKFRGKKILMWTHGYLSEEANLKGLIREKFYKLADALLLYGNRSKEFLIKRGFDKNSLHIVYNSLDYANQLQVRGTLTKDLLKNLRQKLFRFPECPVVVFIGRLTKQKKLELLIETVKTLEQKNFKINLLLIGDGPEMVPLTDLAEQNQLMDHVCFYGACYVEEELGPLIGMADLCVSPGAIGLTCMHALVYGTPVITHADADAQGPEFEAVQPGKTGDFFSRDDGDALAEAIRSWFLKNQDREQIRQNCMKIIDDYYNPAYQTKIINEAVLSLFAH